MTRYLTDDDVIAAMTDEERRIYNGNQRDIDRADTIMYNARKDNRRIRANVRRRLKHRDRSK